MAMQDEGNALAPMAGFFNSPSSLGFDHASPRICDADAISGIRYGARSKGRRMPRIGRSWPARGGELMPQTTLSVRAVRKRSLKRVFPSDPKGQTRTRVRHEEGHAHGPGNHNKMKIIQFPVNIDKFTVFFDKFLKMTPMRINCQHIIFHILTSYY